MLYKSGVKLEDLLLTVIKLDCSMLAPNDLALPKFHLILCTFAFVKPTAISVYSSNISSLIFYVFFTQQVFTSRTYATLSGRFSKTNL